jgi:hypothetical protein
MTFYFIHNDWKLIGKLYSEYNIEKKCIEKN